MNKGTLLNIAEYLGGVRLSEIKDAEIRHAAQDFFRGIRRLAKPIIEDIDDTRREIFADRQGEVNKYAALEAAGDKEGMAAMPETKAIVDDFRAAVDRIGRENVEGELPKISPDALSDILCDKGLSFGEFEDYFGEFYDE